MKGKKLLTILLSIGIGFSAAKVQPILNVKNVSVSRNERYLVSAGKSYKTLNLKTVNYDGEDDDYYSFEEYMGELLEKLNSSEIKELKDIYKNATKLELQANKKWDEFDKELQAILNEKGIEWNTECEDGICGFEGDEEIQDQDYQDFDFDQYLESIKSELETEEYNKLKKLYEKVVILEEKEDYEKADLVWEEIEQILSSSGMDLEDVLDGMQEGELIAAYDVKDGKIVYEQENNIEKPSEEQLNKHKVLWDRVKKIVPKSYISRITSFTINTDGEGGIAGATASINEKNKKYELSMDTKDSFNEKGKLIGKELDHTIIHEFAHILTLNDSQMIKVRDENSKAYTTEEGTTKENSYLNKFYQKFWKNIYKEWEKVNEAANEMDGETTNEDPMLAFYEKHKDQFVSDYASTNPEEDIAESFTAFVMQDKPKGNSISEKKILFFYDFDEAVKLRKEIRKNL